jgi:hypothetical protein
MSLFPEIFNSKGDLVHDRYYCCDCGLRLEIFINTKFFSIITARCLCGEEDFCSLEKFEEEFYE